MLLDFEKIIIIEKEIVDHQTRTSTLQGMVSKYVKIYQTKTRVAACHRLLSHAVFKQDRITFRGTKTVAAPEEQTFQIVRF